jgi:hypothetical protein
MRRNTLIIAFFCICHFLSAQKLITEGKTWQVLITEHVSQTTNSWVEDFIIQEEYTINNQIYRILYSQISGSNQILKGYLREESNKIYHIAVLEDQTLSAEGLLYDFNLNVNDTVFVNNFFTNNMYSPDFPLYVDIVTQEDVNGVMRKKMGIAPYYEEYWYEGIGSSFGVIYAALKSDGDIIFKLLSCKDGDGTVLYQQSNNNVFVSNPNQNSIFYNAENHIITIKEPLLNQFSIFELVDMHGKIILRTNNVSNTINITNIPNGVYVYRLLENSRVIYSGKILK